MENGIFQWIFDFISFYYNKITMVSCVKITNCVGKRLTIMANSRLSSYRVHQSRGVICREKSY